MRLKKKMPNFKRRIRNESPTKFTKTPRIL